VLEEQNKEYRRMKEMRERRDHYRRLGKDLYDVMEYYVLSILLLIVLLIVFYTTPRS